MLTWSVFFKKKETPTRDTAQLALTGEFRIGSVFHWCKMLAILFMPQCFKRLQWSHNRRDGVSNQQPRHCLLNRLFRSRSKKTSKLRVTGLCVGNSLGPVNSTHKWPVTRKLFPFDDVIIKIIGNFLSYFHPHAKTIPLQSRMHSRYMRNTLT